MHTRILGVVGNVSDGRKQVFGRQARVLKIHDAESVVLPIVDPDKQPKKHFRATFFSMSVNCKS